MNTGERVYRYFLSPHRFSTYSEEPRACDICGKTRPGYGGPFYGVASLDFVCEDCLASGMLAGMGVGTNEGYLGALVEQLRGSLPGLDDAGVEALARERTSELEHRTPRPVTWQDFSWPAHCGDYCLFVKEAGKRDLEGLAPDGDGRAYLASHLYGEPIDSTELDGVWGAVRPGSPEDNSLAFAVGVYLFRCLRCGEHIVLWDSQ